MFPADRQRRRLETGIGLHLAREVMVQDAAAPEHHEVEPAIQRPAYIRSRRDLSGRTEADIAAIQRGEVFQQGLVAEALFLGGLEVSQSDMSR